MQRSRNVGTAMVAAGVLVAGLAACSGTKAAAPAKAKSPLLITTDRGPVQGVESAVTGVRSFLAIPYAAAPTGQNAWRPPQPRKRWTTPLNATKSGPSCPQSTNSVTNAFLATPASDPDCLSLDVWAPDAAKKAPVMVWIHGGALTTGSAHQPYYTGDHLAARGVVVVNMNYRLGAQGFLVTKDLAAESANGSVGNYGFLDQQAALSWVKQNISHFGGDPSAVTIFGESAGGFSVCGHLTAPGSKGLFSKAIIESGGGCRAFKTRKNALADGAAFLAKSGCADVACLRGLSDESVIAAADQSGDVGRDGKVRGFDAALVADGKVLSASAAQRAAKGKPTEIPVLIGSNENEAKLFTLNAPEPTDAELVDLAGDFSDNPQALVALYPKADYPTNLDRYRAMSTDVTFTCPTVSFAQVATTAFLYHYTYVSAQNPLGLGATHGVEIAPLFNHPEGITAIKVEVDATSRRVSDALQKAWTSFAKDGDPGPLFDPYRKAGKITVINDPITQTDEIRDGRCDQVNSLTS